MPLECQILNVSDAGVQTSFKLTWLWFVLTVPYDIACHANWISGSVVLWQWAEWLIQTLHHKQKHTYTHTNRHKLVWGCPGVLEKLIPRWLEGFLDWTDSSTLHAGGGFFFHICLRPYSYFTKYSACRFWLKTRIWKMLHMEEQGKPQNRRFSLYSINWYFHLTDKSINKPVMTQPSPRSACAEKWRQVAFMQNQTGFSPYLRVTSAIHTPRGQLQWWGWCWPLSQEFQLTLKP